MRAVLLLKTHIDGYTKADGTYVKPHEDKRAAAPTHGYKPGDRIVTVHGDKYTVVDGDFSRWGSNIDTNKHVIVEEKPNSPQSMIKVENIDRKIEGKTAKGKKKQEDSVRLYHTSHEKHIGTVKDIGMFNGIFTHEDPESAHGSYPGKYFHHIDMPVKHIATHDDISNLSKAKITKARKAIRENIGNVSNKDLGLIFEAASEDSGIDSIPSGDRDRIIKLLSDDEDFARAQADWKLQGLRGIIARAAGYKAVNMSDEHGTSVLVLPGNEMKSGMGEEDMTKCLLIIRKNPLHRLGA